MLDTLAADGSAAADRRDVVLVDRAEHHEIVDARTGETVPYAAVEFPDK